MGMFDYVKISCPRCGRVNIFQSKAGPCSLNKYTLARAPLAVVADLQEDGKRGDLKCVDCGVQFELQVQHMVSVEVKQEDTEWEDDE